MAGLTGLSGYIQSGPRLHWSGSILCLNYNLEDT